MTFVRVSALRRALPGLRGYGRDESFGGRNSSVGGRKANGYGNSGGAPRSAGLFNGADPALGEFLESEEERLRELVIGWGLFQGEGWTTWSSGFRTTTRPTGISSSKS